MTLTLKSESLVTFLMAQSFRLPTYTVSDPWVNKVGRVRQGAGSGQTDLAKYTKGFGDDVFKIGRVAVCGMKERRMQ